MTEAQGTVNRAVRLDIPVADLDRAAAIHRKLLAIGPHGFRAIVRDGEGNRIALHSATDA